MSPTSELKPLRRVPMPQIDVGDQTHCSDERTACLEDAVCSTALQCTHTCDKIHCLKTCLNQTRKSDLFKAYRRCAENSQAAPLAGFHPENAPPADYHDRVLEKASIGDLGVEDPTVDLDSLLHGMSSGVDMPPVQPSSRLRFRGAAIKQEKNTAHEGETAYKHRPIASLWAPLLKEEREKVLNEKKKHALRFAAVHAATHAESSEQQHQKQMQKQRIEQEQRIEQAQRIKEQQRQQQQKRQQQQRQQHQQQRQQQQQLEQRLTRQQQRSGAKATAMTEAEATAQVQATARTRLNVFFGDISQMAGKAEKTVADQQICTGCHFILSSIVAGLAPAQLTPQYDEGVSQAPGTGIAYELGKPHMSYNSKNKEIGLQIDNVCNDIPPVFEDACRTMAESREDLTESFSRTNGAEATCLAIGMCVRTDFKGEEKKAPSQ